MKHTSKYIAEHYPNLAPFSEEIAKDDYYTATLERVDFAISHKSDKIYIWETLGRHPMRYLSDMNKLLDVCKIKLVSRGFDRPKNRYKCDEFFLISHEKCNRRVSYKSAIEWLHGDFVSINNIHEIDENFFENEPTDENGEPLEIFCYYITNLNDDDVEWMGRTFPDIHFAYSERLSHYVLCVDHIGTGWDYVGTDCASKTVYDQIDDPIKRMEV